MKKFLNVATLVSLLKNSASEAIFKISFRIDFVNRIRFVATVDQSLSPKLSVRQKSAKPPREVCGTDMVTPEKTAVIESRLVGKLNVGRFCIKEVTFF